MAHGQAITNTATIAINAPVTEAFNAKLRANHSEQSQLAAAIDAETKKTVALRHKELEYNQLHRRLEEDREAYSLVARRLNCLAGGEVAEASHQVIPAHLD